MPSGVNNILIINKVMTPGRITAIIVRESPGFCQLEFRPVTWICAHHGQLGWHARLSAEDRFCAAPAARITVIR